MFRESTFAAGAVTLVACTTGGSPGNKVGDSSPTATQAAGTPAGAATGGGTGTGSGAPTGTGTGSAATGTGTGAFTTPGTTDCDVVLPATTIVVDTDGGQTVDGATYWVCRQTTMSFSGSSALIVLEGQSDLALNGSGNTVWLQSNSDLASFAGANRFVYEAGAVIDDQAPAYNALQLCPTITIDTSLVPPPGC